MKKTLTRNIRITSLIRLLNDVMDRGYDFANVVIIQGDDGIIPDTIQVSPSTFRDYIQGNTTPLLPHSTYKRLTFKDIDLTNIDHLI